jgi:XrtN system VIT domain protein
VFFINNFAIQSTFNIYFMENKQTNLFKDFTYVSGIALIAVSLGSYLTQQQGDEGRFMLCYLLSIIYFALLVFKSVLRFKLKPDGRRIYYIFLFLILAMISCFSLNNDINIFYDSIGWLNVVLVSMGIALIAAPFKDRFPKWLQVIFFFTMGLGFITCIYFACYLLPYYPVGFAAFFVLGLSLHIFIPLLMAIAIGVYMRKNSLGKRNLQAAFFSAIGFMFVCSICFTLQWIRVSKEVSYQYNKTIINESNIYPAWFRVSQNISDNWINERILKSDLYYAVPSRSNNMSFWNMPSRVGGIVKKHDPFIMIAGLFYQGTDVGIDDRIKIIEAVYGERHLVQERLWSGESLFTKNIITDVKIFQQQRIAYTEKILSIQNQNTPDRWRGGTQEAIYTFALPQGAVVTSLSLWINGKEEKGYLTTKGKADSAYTTIVGVESRDPSVVHWQEGNTVTVRVFPCTPEENRRFKIGITSPLKIENNELVYENITFKGPFIADATETINIRLTEDADQLKLPFDFETSDKRNYLWEGSYQENWRLVFPVKNIPDNQVYFDGHTYSVTGYSKQYAPFNTEYVYLDINKSWTSGEFELLWEKLKDKKVFVYQDRMIQLNAENKNEWFDRLSALNFSMFPFQLTEGNDALVISKSTNTDLFLKDIENTAMSEGLSRYLALNKKIHFFNLGEELSPYLKTLRDFRVFIYDAGTAETLAALIDKQSFVRSAENDHTVVIEDAGIMIHKKTDSLQRTATAPDHLIRLFAYNNILRKIEGHYFEKNYVNDDLISEAEKAYVVTPVSSLIVLETQADYERFDIKDNENNSLKNASMSGSGAVPEPHEWALIIISVVFVAYLVFKNKLSVHAR